MAIVTRTQALKKLYKAVVGSDTSKNDPAKIISELADNWPGGGGGGSGDLTYANVKVNYIGTISPTGFGSSYVYASDDSMNSCVTISYDDNYGLPLSELGSVTNIKVPVYKDLKSSITEMSFDDGEGSTVLIDVSESSVVSGDAEISDFKVLISGDCELNLKLHYSD